MRWLPIIPIHEDSKVEQFITPKNGVVTARQVIPSRTYRRRSLMAGIRVDCIWVRWLISRSPSGAVAIYNVEDRKVMGHIKQPS